MALLAKGPSKPSFTRAQWTTGRYLVTQAGGELTYARGEMVNPRGMPLTMRLLREAHKRLMHGVRGADKSPGAIRTSQNWIGGTRPGNAVYVPLPPDAVPEALSDLAAECTGMTRCLP